MTDMSWFAIRVAPQAEFRVLHALHQRDRPAIVPFEERPVARKNRPSVKRWTKFPLMPGYVFGAFVGKRDAAFMDFWAEKQHINQASEALGKGSAVLGVLGFGTRPEIMRPDQVEFLSGLSREKVEIGEVSALHVGQPVIVYGQTTKITAIRRDKIDVMLQFLGGMRLVSVQHSSVEAA